MAGINGMDRTYYFMHGQDILEQSVYERFLENIRKRTRHIPLQHILGKAFFYGYEFKVNEAVLVPRPDTEILVEQALGNRYVYRFGMYSYYACITETY